MRRRLLLDHLENATSLQSFFQTVAAIAPGEQTFYNGSCRHGSCVVVAQGGGRGVGLSPPSVSIGTR